MNPHYAQAASRANFQCEYCHAPEFIFNFPFEVEHIIPASRGGKDDDSNLALSCRACNLHKSIHLEALDSQTQNLAPLFHPRRDEWREHFAIDTKTGVLSGLTAIGRATVACLQMNRPSQLAARMQWMRLGIFPAEEGNDKGETTH
jgi:hypothetical protein